jgi:hypothetical protein
MRVAIRHATPYYRVDKQMGGHRVNGPAPDTKG